MACPWFAQVMTKGQPSWLTNTTKRIQKVSLTFPAKFWRGVVRYRFLPIGSKKILDEAKAVLMSSLLSGFLIDFGRIIVGEIRAWMTRSAMLLPFPCEYYLMHSCRSAYFCRD